jgi:FkbM family methyltransferase
MKNIIRKVTRSLGFDIVRYFPVPIDQAKAINPQQKGADFLKMLTYKQIDLVLDIGANKGQFASGLLEIGYRGNIVSFEPLSSAYEQLLESRKPYPQWSVFDRCAVGDAEGEIEINISQNSESSSVLPMLQAHLDAAPRSAYVDVEKAPIHRLDAIAEPLVKKA